MKKKTRTKVQYSKCEILTIISNKTLFYDFFIFFIKEIYNNLRNRS